MGSVEKELSGRESVTTNNRMELMAAISALEALKKPVSIVIHADSKYVIQGATEWIEGWRRRGWKTGDKKDVANRELWERLDAAQKRHEVEWKWVRGHAGNVENERVDRIANGEAERAKEQLDVTIRAELDAQIGVSCALADTKGAEKKAPPFCIRGPGNVGVHCLTGSGDAPCPHAFLILERSKLKLRDKEGGSVSIETDDSGKGDAQDRLRAVLRALGDKPR
jgi:ribonuclease HI